ncbi:MAG: hypothetical protein AAFO74_13055 [Pseudomonadota bacterium]
MAYLTEARQVEDNNGVPVSGAKVFFYKAGTTTPQAAYTDTGLTTPAANPVIADASGYFAVYLGGGLEYDIEIKSPDEATTYAQYSRSDGVSDDTALIVETTADLSALDLTAADAAMRLGHLALGEGPTETYYPVTGDQSAEVTNDPGGFDVVPRSTAPNGSLGIWHRAGPLKEIRLDRVARWDGTTDISTAFGQAFARAIHLGGGRIILPAGVGRIMADIPEIVPTAEQDIIIEGQGSDVTELRFSNSVTRGFRYRPSSTTANRLPSIAFKGMGIKTSAEAVGWAIDAEWATAADIEEPFFLEDVRIRQWLDGAADDGSDFGYWLQHIRVSNARNSAIREFQIIGELARSSNRSASGIQLEGETTGFKINNGDIAECLEGIRVQDTCEGVYVDGVDMVAVRDGFVVDITSGGEPQHTFTNGHINSFRYGVYLNNVMQAQITSSAFTAKTGIDSNNPSENWVGVYLTGAATRHGDILGMKFAKEAGHGSGGATSKGVVIDQAFGCNVAVGSCYSDDAGDPMDVGVELGSNSQYCSVTNIQTRHCEIGISDSGTNNKYVANVFRNYTTAISKGSATNPFAFSNDEGGTVVMSENSIHRMRFGGEAFAAVQRTDAGGSGNYIGGFRADAFDSAGNLDTYYRVLVQQQDHTSGSEDTFVEFQAFTGGTFRAFMAYDGNGDTVRPAADSAVSWGADGLRWANVYTDNLEMRPGSSRTPSSNGDLSIEATSNTSLTFKYKGSDGTVRSGSITLS